MGTGELRNTNRTMLSSNISSAKSVESVKVQGQRKVLTLIALLECMYVHDKLGFIYYVHGNYPMRDIYLLIYFISFLKISPESR